MAAAEAAAVVEAAAAARRRHLQGVLSDGQRAVLQDVEGARVQRLRIDVHDELRERQAVGERLEPRVGVRVEGEAPTRSSGAPPASPNAQLRCLTSATFSSSENGESTTAISFSASSAAAWC